MLILGFFVPLPFFVSDHVFDSVPCSVLCQVMPCLYLVHHKLCQVVPCFHFFAYCVRLCFASILFSKLCLASTLFSIVLSVHSLYFRLYVIKETLLSAAFQWKACSSSFCIQQYFTAIELARVRSSQSPRQ